MSARLTTTDSSLSATKRFARPLLPQSGEGMAVAASSAMMAAVSQCTTDARRSP
ncbi:MAG: hypothetical protein ACLTTP_05720 [Alistipes ihumii]